ncbi:signal transduction histidine kinase [Sedimentibacter acidaminivorans]|uniref:histidine kinase n=1 Tax=Sedimentibacter acidaminivorans TaxID=913099 RepID=A0ABS4GER0_9FIRM|nr:sensor histidine kinase [Sedimentibacter acidaminivorans]MBP1926181.1 signal transduction histidine kinase [Sedimentibacter acidaminivorans]
MIKNEKYLYVYILKIIVSSILFISALYFENAQQHRLYVLVALFSFFLINSITKYFINKQSKLYFFSLILDIVLIYFLELNSRLLISYFLHSLYIIILLEASITLQIKQGTIIGILIIIVSMIKFIYLVYYKFNFSNISQMVFFLIANGLILVIGIFAQYNKKEKEKKGILYKELLDTHKKLKESTDRVKRLSVVEERNSIARDIHDNLGHDMTALIMQLQMSEHYLNQNNPLKSQEFLVRSIKTAKDSLSGIRDVVETLRGEDINYYDDTAIKTLVDKFSEKTGAAIDLKISGKITPNYEENLAIFHILQECLTNAVRHGKATKIIIELDYSYTTIRFNIKDNGIGVKHIDEGYGMKGIKERVKNFNGNVEFRSLDGLCVTGSIYLNKGNNGEANDDKITISR